METKIEQPLPSTEADVDLLATCREHMENMRYTNPEDDNALLCYQAVQRQDPGNIEAVQAFETMTAFYLESCEQVLRDGNYKRLRDYIDLGYPAADEISFVHRCLSRHKGRWRR